MSLPNFPTHPTVNPHRSFCWTIYRTPYPRKWNNNKKSQKFQSGFSQSPPLWTVTDENEIEGKLWLVSVIQRNRADLDPKASLTLAQLGFFLPQEPVKKEPCISLVPFESSCICIWRHKLQLHSVSSVSEFLWISEERSNPITLEQSLKHRMGARRSEQKCENVGRWVTLQIAVWHQRQDDTLEHTARLLT